MLILAGQQPGWLSPLIPTTRAELLPTLSTEWAELMADADYHMLRQPLSYEYSAVITDFGGNDDSDLTTVVGLAIGAGVGVVVVVILAFVIYKFTCKPRGKGAATNTV